jgi:hypothetical protein
MFAAGKLPAWAVNMATSMVAPKVNDCIYLIADIKKNSRLENSTVLDQWLEF